MDLKSEEEIRSRAGNIALAWYVERHGEFGGDNPRDYADMIGASHVAADESRLALHRWVDAGRRPSASRDRPADRNQQAAVQQRFGGAATRRAAEQLQERRSSSAPRRSTRCRCSRPAEGAATRRHRRADFGPSPDRHGLGAYPRQRVPAGGCPRQDGAGRLDLCLVLVSLPLFQAAGRPVWIIGPSPPLRPGSTRARGVPARSSASIRQAAGDRGRP